MPALVRLIGIEDDGGAEREDAKARIKAAEAALARIEEIAEEGWANEDSLERARGQYRFRTNRFRRGSRAKTTRRRGALGPLPAPAPRAARRRAQAVLALRNEGLITEEVMQRVQRDIDLEDRRLDA